MNDIRLLSRQTISPTEPFFVWSDIGNCENDLKSSGGAYSCARKYSIHSLCGSDRRNIQNLWQHHREPESETAPDSSFPSWIFYFDFSSDFSELALAPTEMALLLQSWVKLMRMNDRCLCLFVRSGGFGVVSSARCQPASCQEDTLSAGT